MATRMADSARLFDYRIKREATYDHGAPFPVPDVIDDDSDASWELWREATRGQGNWEESTVPMGLSAE